MQLEPLRLLESATKTDSSEKEDRNELWMHEIACAAG